MWFVERACTDRHQGFRRELCHRRDICENLLPQRDQYRTADHRAKAIEAGDEVEVDFDSGIITDKTKNTSYQGQAFPPFMQKIIDCEGLVNYINQK